MLNKSVCVFLLIFICHCTALNNDIKKDKIVNEIMQKVLNFTLKSLPASTYREKINILKKIESKLQKTVDSFGPRGDKYKQLIMQGIKAISLNDANKVNNNNTSNWNMIRKNNLRFNNLTFHNYNNKTDNKEKTVKDIAHRIEILAKESLEDAKTLDEKRRIIEKIRKKITNLAKKKHIMIHNKHNDIKAFSDLITQGVELMMHSILVNSSRRIPVDFVNMYNVDDKNPISYEAIANVNQRIDISTNVPIDINSNELSTSIYMNLSHDLPCEIAIDRACSKIKSINQMKCAMEDSYVTVDKLCNGVYDCGDRSDEYYCVAKAARKVQNATNIVLEIESKLLRRCINTKVNSSILQKQNKILSNVLQSQLSFIQKYTNTKTLEEIKGNNVIKKTINEVAIVLSSVSLALEGSICPRYYSRRNAEDMAQNSTNLLSEDLDKSDLEIPLKYCSCDNGFCAINNCTAMCRRVCWEKYILGRFGCQAVGENSSIPLDFLCDGKLDCYDETDEIGCIFGVTYAKFEAVEMYNMILKIITSKASSDKYASVRNRLLSLHSSIKKLQNLTVKAKPDTVSIKAARDSSFEMLTSIYNDIVNKNAVNLREMDEAHVFLMSLNEKFVIALKRSNTGNERILTTNGCFCKNGRCVLVECSKKCSRACSAEPKLTRYYCKGELKNNFIPIESICDGKNQCPNGDDETNCKKDICRKHHLMVLRNSLSDVDIKYKGTALGEILNSWKLKVTATLNIAENNGRPTITILKDVVSDILRDLVESYTSVDEVRRSNGNEKFNNFVYKDFFKLSQQILDILKQCGQ